eukprot:TRINITY_DN73723_c0_g1_i1.p1 TRINITY_DN73723_c0_g1~~TRINITY_DN73723_c0_g1_i1.p1  ORF type:complete len:307 (+),score=156.68 TRINITY_DN73723_c0_g1_i1:103-921(+)
MGKQKKSGGNANSAPAKPKTAKIMSLKDTKDTPKKAAPKKEEEKKVVAPKQEKKEEKDRDLTKREIKDERKATDRHAPRSGHADARGKKTDEVQDEVDAQKGAGAVAADERRKERDEEEAARRAKEEELAKKITYTEYEKLQAEKKAELGIKKLEARKVDNKGFAKMATLKKEEEPESMDFGLNKTEAKKEVKTTKDSKKKGQAEVKPATKKNKFVKSSDIQLGFTAPRPQQTRREFRPRPQEAKPAAPAPAVEEEKTEAPAAEAPVAEATE